MCIDVLFPAQTGPYPEVLKCRHLQTVIDDVNSYRSKVITLKQQVHYLSTGLLLRWYFEITFLIFCYQGFLGDT